MKDYLFQSGSNVHIARRKAMLEKYPAIRDYYGPYKLSGLYIVSLVVFQLILASLFTQMPFWFLVIAAYAIGAFANHALYVMIHECTHNLVLSSALGNKVMGLVCDIPLFLPSAMGFRKYHMIHHKHLGEYSYDPDITSYTEARMIGNSSVKKALWLFFFSLSQALRPLKVQFYKPLNFWTVLNSVLQVFVNLGIYFLLGKGALIYLGLSTLFALGLHPLGGRWIQEHYVTQPGQETYSYYGPLNKLTFNMGYHNEHHDFMNIPWIKLPKLKAMAPEFYDNLASYQSWSRVVFNFIFNPQMSSFSRIIHEDNHPAGNEGLYAEVTAEIN